MRILQIMLLLLLPLSLFADAPRAFDYSAFAQIPILHEGRIKPLDSFARATLKHISGETAIAQTPAIKWLAQVVFAPSDAMNERVFSVQDITLVNTLSLSAQADGHYSFSELAAAFSQHHSALAAIADKDKKDLTSSEQELAILYDNVNDFADMIGAFSLLMPMADVDKDIRHKLGVSDNAPVSYLDLLKIRNGIETKKRLNAHLTLMEAMDEHNTLLRVIPPFWEGSDEWLAPWAVIAKGAGSPQSAALFADWQKLALAYQQNNAASWQQTAEKLLAVGSSAPGVRSWALKFEVLYNESGLLSKSVVAYGLGFMLAVTGLFLGSRWTVAAYVVLGCGAVLHSVAIAMRMAILMRPPVSTLYESMIFVSFIAMLFGLMLERKRKGADGLIISSAIASLLLVAANVFAGNSDTLEVLVAVLNTNFWLATHVVCITTGYGSSLVAGTLAHLYLFKRGAGRGEQSDMEQRMYVVALVALLFTAVGTMLGGIWADQSWGRFWGWDPKENGALWIVLWLIWLLHGRVAGQLGKLGFAVGLAFINIVVALAWVGVNLLSVGLHSYGFTSTAANGLVAFCAFEFCFIGIAVLAIMRRRYV